ncbi:uncharacterized protein [Drosophila takahashii]|uniref:uncharacterized protein n=1 Tax=Drosophila takahashii TaxID=29030 RepID=UPI0038995DD2
MERSVTEATFIANIERTARSTLLPRSNVPIHTEMIEYAVASTRLFFIHHPSAWRQWTSKNEAFEDLSAQDACDIFQTEVLPQLDTYKLPQPTKRRLKLLDMHPFFSRVENGYQYTPDPKLTSQFALQHHRDFLLTGDVQKYKKIGFEGRSQIVVIDKEEAERMTCVGYNSKVSHETSVLLSVMFSTDKELSIGQMQDLGEIHQRMRRAKQAFEDTAKHFPFRLNIDDLVYNMEIFVKVKSKICKVLSDFRNKELVAVL